MIVLRVVVIIALTSWFALSVLNQLSFGWAKRLTPPDVLHLIPRWTFFAPRPGMSDHHLLVRQLRSDGVLSEFRELPIRDRGRWAFLLNPDKRVKKAVLDLAIILQRLLASAEWDTTNIRMSFPYLVLLHYISGVHYDESTLAIQFCILVTSGPRDVASPRLLLSSEFHRVQ
jgi:hypothetical protein